jgi:iron complex outermembrane receptor protein
LKRTSELVSLSRNTGDATVVGWELQTDVVISDDWTANVGVSYTDSVWDKARQATYQFLPSFFVPNPDPDGLPLGGDISGHQMLRVAPWTVNASLQYRHELGNDWSFYGRSDVSWKDSWYVGNDNQSTVPASTFVNLRLGIESESYTVELWVNNLFDYSDPIGAFRDIFWTNTQDLQSANDPPTSTLADFPPIRLSLNQPSLRTYGITGRVRFGGARQ